MPSSLIQTYGNFNEIITDAYQAGFIIIRFPRKRMTDAVWIKIMQQVVGKIMLYTKWGILANLSDDEPAPLCYITNTNHRKTL